MVNDVASGKIGTLNLQSLTFFSIFSGSKKYDVVLSCFYTISAESIHPQTSLNIHIENAPQTLPEEFK